MSEKTNKPLDEWDLLELEKLVGDFINSSQEVYGLLRNPRYAQWSTPHLDDKALDLYTEGRAIGESLPFSTLVIYIAALGDILLERLKN